MVPANNNDDHNDNDELTWRDWVDNERDEAMAWMIQTFDCTSRFLWHVLAGMLGIMGLFLWSGNCVLFLVKSAIAIILPRLRAGILWTGRHTRTLIGKFLHTAAMILLAAADYPATSSAIAVGAWIWRRLIWDCIQSSVYVFFLWNACPSVERDMAYMAAAVLLGLWLVRYNRLYFIRWVYAEGTHTKETMRRRQQIAHGRNIRTNAVATPFLGDTVSSVGFYLIDLNPYDDKRDYTSIFVFFFEELDASWSGRLQSEIVDRLTRALSRSGVPNSMAFYTKHKDNKTTLDMTLYAFSWYGTAYEIGKPNTVNLVDMVQTERHSMFQLKLGGAVWDDFVSILHAHAANGGNGPARAGRGTKAARQP